MPDIDVVAKKWGDSIAVIIPKKVVKAERIKPNDKLHITICREMDLSPFFGRFKSKKTTQEIIDEERKGWM